MKPHETILYAARFAAAAHGNQVRKYTGEPYICHCFRVAEMIAAEGYPLDATIAAVLHDVIEDTDATIEDVRERFGFIVADYVTALTDSPLSMGNRRTRKALDRERLCSAPDTVQAIKCADIIDNLPSIIKHDPTFGQVMWAEVGLLLNGMSYRGSLWKRLEPFVQWGIVPRI